MYKTKYTSARHTNSEEYLKVKTKLECKIKLQNVKSDVIANILIFAKKNFFYVLFHEMLVVL